MALICVGLSKFFNNVFRRGLLASPAEPLTTSIIMDHPLLRFKSSKASKGKGKGTSKGKGAGPSVGPGGGAASRKTCVVLVDSTCSEEGKKVDDKCAKKKIKDAIHAKKQKTFESMWENRDCCHDPCPDVYPRFDALYYKTSDKRKRRYQITWSECPDIRIIPKKVCCYDKIRPPPLSRRSKAKKDRQKAKTACEPSNKCITKKQGKCTKLTLSTCQKAREPPSCRLITPKKVCKRVCTPYPAFSECQRPRLKKSHPVECDCLRVPSLCEVFVVLRQQLSSKKV